MSMVLCFNDVLSETLLFRLRHSCSRTPVTPLCQLNLHRIINVGRLAIEKHFASIPACGKRLWVIKSYYSSTNF